MQQKTLVFLLVCSIALSAFWAALYIPKIQDHPVVVSCQIPDRLDVLGWLDTVASLGNKIKFECESVSRPVPVKILLNETTGEESLVKLPGNEELICSYVQIYYERDDSFQVDEEELQIFNESTPVKVGELKSEVDGDKETTKFVQVLCVQENGHEKTVVYDNVHIFMPRLSQFKRPSLNGTKGASVKVLVLAIESMAQRNFHRNLPKTVAALEDLGNTFYLRGFNKLGDNTLPNMIAFLTGRVIADYPGGDLDGEMDGLSHIWKAFERRGYPTAMIDDNPFDMQSALSYATDGFNKPPTTFYPQPFWTYWKKERLYSRNCLGGIYPVPKLYFEQIERFISLCDRSQLPYFVMSMLIRCTHDGWRFAPMLDGFYEAFLRNNSGRLKDTVLVLLGDHGDRNSPEMLHTPWGHSESMNPLMAIRLPDSLLEAHPSMGHFLRRNEHRLTTALDVHKALFELARLNDQKDQQVTAEESKEEREFSRGAISVISEEVPFTRTCTDARVNRSDFCACEGTPFRVMEEGNHSLLLLSIGEHLTEQLNDRLPKALCEPLKLLRVETVLLEESQYWVQELYRQRRIDLMALFAPGNIRLRVTMTRHRWNFWGHYAPVAIQRVDGGGAPGCMKNTELAKFCFCRDLDKEVALSTANSTSFGKSSSEQ